MRRIAWMMTVLCLLPAPPTAAATFLRQFNVQEVTRLRPGRYTFTFNLYRTSSGGSPVFTEKKRVTLTSPILTHALGSVNRAGMRKVIFTGQLYLEVKRVGTTVPVVRRKPFYVAPYAIHSLTAANAGGGDITAVSAGAGLSGGGTSGVVTLAVGPTYQLPQSCGAGEVAQWNGASWSCGAPSGLGDITAVNTGPASGLSGGVTAGAANLAVAAGSGILVDSSGVSVSYAGSGTASTAARSNHTHAALGIGNSAVGSGALSSNDGEQNTAFGSTALNANTAGRSNTALGSNALRYNTVGDFNTATGDSALFFNTSGGHNTAMGKDALRYNTVGDFNTATGNNALFFNTSGSNNTASGVNALLRTTGHGNTASGVNALFSNTGGNYNTATGISALYSNSTGSGNTALGFRAGQTATPANANTTGSNNTFLGTESGPGVSAPLTNATAVGYGALVNQSDSMVLGNGANVGIGTSAPQAKLHVSGGDIKADSNVSFGTALRQMLNLYNTAYGIGIQNYTLYQRTDLGAGFAWYQGGSHSNAQGDPGAGGSALMALDSGGNLGIGTPTPQARLHARGTGPVLRLEGTDHVYAEFFPRGAAAGRKAWIGYGSAATTVLSVVNEDTGGLNLFPGAGGATLTGNLAVTGTLTKGGGSFKIDHPLDPANRTLSHSFVESPDMMNIYNGNVTTDGRGYATVELPAWFEALNRDFRYQLTVIDTDDREQFVQAKIVREIEGSHFTIRTSAPGARVSWQVTGIRQDPWANLHRIPVEEAKPVAEQGTYLHPDAYGQAIAGAKETP